MPGPVGGPVDPGRPPGEAAPSPRLVRPYTITAGRTRASVDLPVEAVLRVRSSRSRRRLAPAVQQVLDLCEARSVAEVSALAGMPLGVVRVLLGDLVEQGRVEMQATITEGSSSDERIELIERTLRGLRAY